MPTTDLTPILMLLTRRQRDVIELVADGYTNRQIAERLYIEPCVVASHLTNIYGTLAVCLAETEIRVNRYTVISIFSAYFALYPDLRPSALPNETKQPI